MQNSHQVPIEVIVVEGRSDTQRLIETFGPLVKTIETNGSAIDQEILDRIERAHQTYGVIVFTDPDYPGQRIRRKILERIPLAKEAFLTQQETNAHRAGYSLGIEHASPRAIRLAIEKVSQMTPVSQGSVIKMADLYNLGLVGSASAAEARLKVAEHFNLGHVNAKQLQKQLTKYQIPIKSVQEVLQKRGEE